MFRGRKTYKINRWGSDSENNPNLPEDRDEVDQHVQSFSESVADVVSSQCEYGDWHMPVLDLDVPHHYEESTTPGHGHLYIDQPMTWPAYRKLLEALRDAAILEPGYVGASIDRQATFVRLPWIKKGARHGKASASA